MVKIRARACWREPLLAVMLMAGCEDEQGSSVDAGAIQTEDAAARDGGGGGHDHGDEGPLERLLIADAVSPRVHVVDVAPAGVHRSFDLKGVARVYGSGNLGFAVQGEADVVSVVRSGLTLEDHGDHLHGERGNAALLPFEASGDYPVHFVAHDGYVVLFFDNDGRAHVIEEASLSSSEPVVHYLTAEHPHHGVALTFHDHVLMTRAELAEGATRATPTGVAVYQLDGTPTGDVFGGCSSVHGEATRAQLAVFGCAEGALLVELGADGFTGRVIPNPASDLTPAPRIGTVVVHERLAHAIGNYGSEALCAIDPAASTITPHALGERYVQFDVTPDGKTLVVLLRSGELSLRDPGSFDELARFAATSAVSDDSNHGARYPQFAFGEHDLYVSDPDRAQVHVVDLISRKVLSDIDVEGVPAKLTVLRPSVTP